MPDIYISDDLFSRLQQHARAFIDTTPAHVITRILGEWEERKAVGSLPGRNEVTATEFDPLRPPPMEHTRLLSASFGGKALTTTTWDGLVYAALKQGLEKLGSFEKLRMAAQANIVQGKRSDKGYKYIPECDFSYQGLSAGDALRCAVGLARTLGFSLEILFEWRNKGEAAFPGTRGQFNL